MNYYVLADVHSFFDEMQKALTESGYYEDAEEKKIILCGDIFDRGPKSGTLKMQEWVVERLKKNEIILVRGNHEDLIVELAENLEKYAGMLGATHHYRNGTAHTLYYLTDYDFDCFLVGPDRVRTKFYNTPFYKKILPAMVDYFETKNYIFVHGWLPCVTGGSTYRPTFYQYMTNWRNASKERWEMARWYNGMEAFREGVKEPGKTIVCGHWHCSWGHSYIEGKGNEYGNNADFEPFYADGIIAIDAATAHSGKVNCIVIKNEDPL